MKLEANIAGAPPRLHFQAEMRTIGDVAAAIDALESAARVAFPNIVFRHEPEWADADPVEPSAIDNPAPEQRPKPDSRPAPVERAAPRRDVPRSSRNLRGSASAEVRPGSFFAKVLDAAKRHGADNVEAIADELDAYNHHVGAAITRLRRGGHLPAKPSKPTGAAK